MARSFLTEIEHQYGIRISKYYALRDVYRIETTRKEDLCLKPYRIPAGEVRFITAVLNHLVQNGFLYSPRLFLTYRQSPYFQYGNNFYMLTNWVNGKSPIFQDMRQLRKSVRTLARFHRHAESLNIIEVPDGRLRVWSLKKRFECAKQTIQKDYGGDDSRKRIAVEMCERALEMLTNESVTKALEREAEAKAFVHGDYNYPNLVVDQHNHHHLIDFDNTSYHARMEDLAHIIHRNYPWRNDGAIRLIDIYNRVRIIEKNDIYLLVALLYEPYPLIRAIQQKKRHPHLNDIVMPSVSTFKQYSNFLTTLL